MKYNYDLSYIFDENSKILEAYDDILPFVLLINYRVHNFRGTEGLFFGDDGYQKNWSFIHWLRYFSCIPFYYTKRCKRKKVDERILLSDTFVLSNRYNSSLEQLLSREDVVGIIGSDSCDIASFLAKQKEGGIEKKKFDALQIPLGMTTAGFKLKKTVYKVYEAFDRLYKEGKHAEECADEIIPLLEKLREDSSKRINIIRKILIKYGIKQFITVNEYNLKDLLIIMAMKGIPGTISKNYNHHVYFTNWSAVVLESDFRNCDKYYYWNKTDAKFVDKYFKFVKDGSCFENDYCGTPELVLNDKLIKSDAVERKKTVVFFAPYVFGSDDEYYVPLSKEKRHELYEKLNDFAKANNVQIILRIHPGEFGKDPTIDSDIIKEFGFLTANDSATQLQQILLDSVAAMGCGTSAEYIALAMGCETFYLDAENLNLSNDLAEIKRIELDDLPNLRLTNEKCNIRKNLFFNMEKLLEI